MSRFRRVLALAAVAAGAAFPQTGATAVNTLTYTFPLLCSDAGGERSDEYVSGLTLPNGLYAVTVTGACTITVLGHSVAGATPCSAPVVGAIPCVNTGITVNNLPSAICGTSVSGTARTDCPTTAGLIACGHYSVRVAGGCVDGAGTVYHGGGVMSAQFVDDNFSDNGGVLLITVTWTPA
jgi:hypothetical protein